MSRDFIPYLTCSFVQIESIDNGFFALDVELPALRFF